MDGIPGVARPESPAFGGITRKNMGAIHFLGRAGKPSFPRKRGSPIDVGAPGGPALRKHGGDLLSKFFSRISMDERGGRVV